MGRAEYTSVAGLWDGVRDPRKARGKRYGWPLLLTLIAWAMACGQKNVAAMGDWVHLHEQELRVALGLGKGRLPSTATLRRALGNVDIEELERLCAALAATAPCREEGQGRFLGQAIDGKAVRGATRHGESLCLVARVAHGIGRVLDQVAVADKSNEITAVPELLARSADSDVVITMDALLTQRGIAEQIIASGSDYLMVAKDNQPRLASSIALHFLEGPPNMTVLKYETMEKGHGRLEYRCYSSGYR